MAGIQIGGIMSGFDTSAMVAELMEAERASLNRVEENKAMAGYEQEAYTKMNKVFSDFIFEMRDLFGVDSLISNTGATRPSASSSLSWLNQITSSNETALGVKTNGTSSVGTHAVKIHQLADTAKFASQANVTLDPDKPLKDQLGVEEFELTITTKDGSTTIKDPEGTLTLSELTEQLNQIEGIDATYDKTLNRFFIQTSETGAEQFIQIDDSKAGGLLDALHLPMQSNEAYHGQNAVIDYNGASGLEFTSNHVSIQGLDLTLKQADPTQTITISSDMDVEAVTDKMKTFVNAYNTLVEELSDALTQDKFRDFPPLTAEQKKDMTEKEIELWEEKTKSGLLRNDRTLQAIQNELRSSLLQPVQLADGTTISLEDFGIKTKGYFEGGENGGLMLDESKFKEALKTKGDALPQLLFNVPTDNTLNTLDSELSSSQLLEKRATSGIFNRMTDIIVNGMQETIQKAGLGEQGAMYREVSANILTGFVTKGSQSFLDLEISDFNKRLDVLNAQLDQKEDRYWAQFTAMETAMSQMQAQQASLAGMLGL